MGYMIECATCKESVCTSEVWLGICRTCHEQAEATSGDIACGCATCTYDRENPEVLGTDNEAELSAIGEKTP